MSLPIQKLRLKLQELIEKNNRGYMASLAAASTVPDGTIYRIAYGKQKTVTYKIWKQLYDTEPQLPAPPTFIDDADDSDGPARYFVAALRHLFPIDNRFKTAEDLALSVGLRSSEIKRLLRGDGSKMPSQRHCSVIAHAFGMSLDEFLSAGRQTLNDSKRINLNDLKCNDLFYHLESAATRHPDIAQIVSIAEKLDDQKIRILKEIALKLLLSSL